ncbi:MAG: hypothetical protein QM749_17430 [Aquabacterium sp.]
MPSAIRLGHTATLLNIVLLDTIRHERPHGKTVRNFYPFRQDGRAQGACLVL